MLILMMKIRRFYLPVVGKTGVGKNGSTHHDDHDDDHDHDDHDDQDDHDDHDDYDDLDGDHEIMTMMTIS